MAENKNLAVWDSFEKTDPEFTKEFKRGGGFSGTAINAMYAIKKMTEKFGPMGKGWGIESAEENIMPINDEILVFVKVTLWWGEETADGKRFKHVVGPQWGGDKAAVKRKDGSVVPDDEALKKACTDGMLKCMSYLGIAADLHLGYYDDNKYINSLAKEFDDNSTMPKQRERPTTTPPAAPATPAASGTESVSTGMTKMPTPDPMEVEASEMAALQKGVDEAWALAQRLLLEKHAGDVKAARDEAAKASEPWLKGVNTKNKKDKLTATKVGLAHFIAKLNEKK